jgi:2-polyprenyl-3-methyl-5-hydroxy-6-metoxy-1,4-benzoquinol methylase
VANEPPLNKHPIFGYYYYEPPDESFLREHYERKYFQQHQSYSSEYSREECEFFVRGARQKIAMVKGFLRRETLASMRCLELGAGEGWSMAALEACGASVVGIDYSREPIEKWNPSLADALIVGHPEEELRRLAAVGERFDLVWLDNVLEHVPDPERLLGEIRGVMSAGAMLLVEVPNDISPLHRYLQAQGLIERPFWQAYPEHLSYFTQESLQELLRAHSFQVVDVIGDFPIDLFLLNSAANYVNDRSRGRDAHLARVRFDAFTSAFGEVETLEFHRSLARLSLGRNISVLARDVRGGA